MAEAAADWSHLPSDLLSLITTHLDTQFDLLRFRSVCSTWRNLHLSLPSPPPLSILPVNGISSISWGFYLFKRSIFILSNPQLLTQSWLVKVEHDNSSHLVQNHVTHLVNPLSHTRFDLKRLEGFPGRIDLMGIRALELGEEYVLQHISYRPFATSIGDAGNQYMEKVGLLYDSRFGYVILTIHVSGKLAIIRIGDKNWTVIADLVSPYDDVAVFEGRFYAVDNTGRVVVVNLGDLSEFKPVVELVANPVFGGDKKTMVASCGELLLVDTYLSVGREDDAGYEEEVEFYEEEDCYMRERTVQFQVFRLNWGEKRWDEVKDLGDKILILGDYCAFSAPALAFDGCKGNCIIFVDNNFYVSREEGNGELKGPGAGVFDLESGRIGSLSDYSKMFWPPPSWICSATLEESDCYMSERFVRFRVFKLNWGEKKWDEVKDLCDKILILGDCAFSAPASYFDGCKGNCIIFADPKFYASREEGNGEMKGRGACVFDLESGRIGYLSDYPCYSKMFWPPPSWICSATLKDDLNQLQI